MGRDGKGWGGERERWGGGREGGEGQGGVGRRKGGWGGEKRALLLGVAVTPMHTCDEVWLVLLWTVAWEMSATEKESQPQSPLADQCCVLCASVCM